MPLNEKQTFSLKGRAILNLHGKIAKLQRLHRASTAVKVMLADNTAALQAAVDAIYADPDYETDSAAVLAVSRSVEGYLLEEDQVPPSTTVEQIADIRAFINL